MSKTRIESRLLKMILLCRWIRQVAWLCPVILLVSCATKSSRSAAAADVELRFFRWDSVCIAKPVTRANGFAEVLDAAEVIAQIERSTLGRGVAAVVVGFSYDEQQTRDIGAEWYRRLAPLGFQRVIVFRGTEQWPIAKLPIVYDSAISSVNDTRGLRPNAATPSAPRADAAHPSIAAIR